MSVIYAAVSCDERTTVFASKSIRSLALDLSAIYGDRLIGIDVHFVAETEASKAPYWRERAFADWRRSEKEECTYSLGSVPYTITK